MPVPADIDQEIRVCPSGIRAPFTIGYRGWRVTPEGELNPIVSTQKNAWAPGINQAYCSSGAVHPTPCCDCGCGYYAYRYVNQRSWESQYFDAREGSLTWDEGIGLVGGVALWQEKHISQDHAIVQADYAAVGCLITSRDMDDDYRRYLDLASERYMVPVVPLKRLKKEVATTVQCLRKETLPEVEQVPLAAFYYDYSLLL